MSISPGVAWCATLIVLASRAVGVQAAEPLTLAEAVESAVRQAPQLAAERAAVDSARSQAISAGRLPDPELVLGLDNVPVNGADAYAVGADFMTMRKVGVMQAFPNAKKRTAERARALAAVDVARARGAQSLLDVSRAAADAWIELHIAQAVLAKLKALEPEVRLQADAARTALASGRGSSVDALAGQQAISELTDRVLIAKRDVHAARAELTRWIGEDAQRALARPPSFAELPAPRAQLVAAVHRHATLRAIDAQRAVAQSDIDLSRAAKRPDFSVQLGYAQRGAAFSNMASLEFRVGLPLFSRHRQNPLISARRADLALLGAERDAELRMHEAQIQAVLAAWDAARERLSLYERERLPLARAQTRAALSGYAAGEAALDQALASRLAEIEAHRAYAELFGELGRAWIFLRYLETQAAP